MAAVQISMRKSVKAYGVPVELPTKRLKIWAVDRLKIWA
jgi:hypothetical protein